ncbi:MAG: tetratricopeptide repeat protein [Bryobacterales bacterium]|nr:tetratricopeptide repeat protein [Bryobacterales bacterium]
MSPAVSGSGNITVHVCGDHNTVAVCQRPGVHLWRPRPRRPVHEREVLYSHLETIPFTARQSELALVERWLSGEQTISVLTFTGAGGTGKTRLALELFHRHEQEWSSGFITGFHEPHSLAAAPAAPPTRKPLLAVVDYAASHTEDLRKFLEDLAQYGTPVPKVRILLLERFADPQSGWYQRLFSYSQTACTADLFHQAEPVRLGPVSELTDRRTIFERTLDASAEFHAKTPRPDGQLDDTLLGKPDFADPLVVMMAALAAWEKGVYGALTLNRPDLAVVMARREKTRLDKRSPSVLLAHLATHSTLCGGFDRETLIRVAREESEALGMEYGTGPGQLARDLAELLPGTSPGASGAVLPDIIGEAFVLDGKPEGIARAAHRNGGAVVRTLTRALQDFYDPHTVRGKSQFNVDGAQAVAWLRTLATEAEAGDLELLRAIGDNLPDSSLELAPLAAEVTARLVDHLSALADLPEDLQAERARLLNNYGNRLSDIGQREAALEAAREALEIYRQLAAARPDAFLPDLARSLSNYGNCLSDTGQREAALKAAREALQIYRQLAAARPDAFLPDLAMSLNNYGNRLSDTGQREAALEAAREALALYRELAVARPDAFLPDLANSLNNYGTMLSDIGQREAAVEAAREAVEIRRQLAAARPDAFLPDLAMSLNNYGLRLSDIGQREAALEAARKALEIYRQLAAARPDAFLSDLARSLNNYGNRLRDIGQREAALEAAREALQIYRELAAARPDAFLPDLATSLAATATVTSDPGESAALFHEAIEKLLPPFLQIPQAHARLMGRIAGDYLKQCQQLDCPSDDELLTRILPGLERLRNNAEGASS